MKNHNGFPLTYQNHPCQGKFRKFLLELFFSPDPELVPEITASFLRQFPLPLDDFPRQEKAYTRTIVHRASNGFEAMAARWSKGAQSSVHGHPFFTFYYVIEGKLKIDNYRQNERGVSLDSSTFLGQSEYFYFIGEVGRFDNNIHQVKAIEETLSVHISSDTSAKSEVFS